MRYSDHIYEPFYSGLIGNLIDKYMDFIESPSSNERIRDTAKRFYNELRSDLALERMNYPKFFKRHEENIFTLEGMLSNSKTLSA